jgi:hypothetical protein
MMTTLETTTNVLQLIRLVLGNTTANRYLAMCIDSSQRTLFQTLKVDDQRMKIAPMAFSLNKETSLPFVVAKLIVFPLGLLQKRTPTFSSNFIENIKQGAIILPMEFFIKNIEPATATLTRGGIRKDVKKTKIDSKYIYKKRSYSVYTGKRGGLYIKVKGIWKSIPKHSLNKQQ